MIIAVLFSFIPATLLVSIAHYYAFGRTSAGNRRRVIESSIVCSALILLMTALGVIAQNLHGVSELWFAITLALLFGLISGSMGGDVILLVKREKRLRQTA